MSVCNCRFQSSASSSATVLNIKGQISSSVSALLLQSCNGSNLSLVGKTGTSQLSDSSVGLPGKVHERGCYF